MRVEGLRAIASQGAQEEVLAEVALLKELPLQMGAPMATLPPLLLTFRDEAALYSVFGGRSMCTLQQMYRHARLDEPAITFAARLHRRGGRRPARPARAPARRRLPAAHDRRQGLRPRHRPAPLAPFRGRGELLTRGFAAVPRARAGARRGPRVCRRLVGRGRALARARVRQAAR